MGLRDGAVLYVFDLDGVIYRGAEPQPGARETILTLRDKGRLVRFFTNNAAESRRSYSEKLNGFGIPTPIEHIMTSAYATALYFQENGASGKTVYRIGAGGMAEELRAAGMRVIYDQEEPDARIDYVVVGIDRAFHYRMLARAMQAILEGAEFIASNRDPTYPVESGALLPGGGCLVAALATAVGREPQLIGKPETYALEKMLQQADTPGDRTVVIGDRLDTDIVAGNRIGARTVLVLTGVTSRDQAEAAKGDMRPDVIIDTLAELIE